ncbi:MAG TPA: 2Fe-2S iron-sulfur cluster binding domain-containing protein [Gammaproteobacteria bacterium]|nr:2Fe-2S iron-sulfur cluster binding domain-containing protein [Gammaproteobacteria bacterium]
MSATVTFLLDGKAIPFQDGDTVMDAALRAGEYIPHLCHNPEFTPHGSCRVCIVEVNGRHYSACTLPAAENMNVDNSSEAIMAKRRSLLQMLFVEGNHICPACEKSGACQLQAVAYYTRMLSPHFPHFFPRRSIDATHPDIIFYHNRCILCGLCERASRDVDGKNVFTISGRGMNSRVIFNSDSGKLGDSELSISDRAASICPVGAILPKSKGYQVPIGQRLYDTRPISLVGDSNIRRNDKT